MNVPLGKQSAAKAKEADVFHEEQQPLFLLVVATSFITLIPSENKVRWQPTWSSANQLSPNPVSQR